MKRISWILPFLLLALFALFAFAEQQDPNRATVKGRVKPFNAALHVWAVSDTDTLSGTVSNGEFTIKNLKPGKYRIIAEGLKPYKVTTKPDVNLSPGAVTDIGEIVLDQ